VIVRKPAFFFDRIFLGGDLSIFLVSFELEHAKNLYLRRVYINMLKSTRVAKNTHPRTWLCRVEKQVRRWESVNSVTLQRVKPVYVKNIAEDDV
jgi:hypothetical protein